MIKYSTKYLIVLLLFVSSCSEKKEKSTPFEFQFDEKTMIINEEQDNTIEGSYLKIKSKIKNEIIVNLPTHFYINELNKHKWTIGWGNDKLYYDNGCENIREILSLNPKSKSIKLGEIIRGKGFPKNNQPIVFWNRSSSNFKKKNNHSILDLNQWKEFSGSSNSFGGIEFDEKIKKWVILFQECDTNKKQIYAGESTDLLLWKPSLNGKPILKYTDFKNINWAYTNYKMKQTPDISDLFYLKNKWIIVLNGTDKNGNRTVGLAFSKISILGPYKIMPRPILKAGNSTSWNNKGCFSGKITSNKNKFVIAFDGINEDKEENVGLAFSNDLIHWTLSTQNPVINTHSGWRSKKESSETNYIKWKEDTMILLISGTKQFKQGFYSHYISRDRFKSKSGNVDDAQLGVYISVNNGESFFPHKNNPIIINDYSNPSENEHIGGNVKFIETDTMTYFFYQAKTSQNGLKYSIYLKTRQKPKR